MCATCEMKDRLYAAANLDRDGAGYTVEEAEQAFTAIGTMLAEMHAGMTIPDNQMRAKVKQFGGALLGMANQLRKQAICVGGQMVVPTAH